MKTIQLFALSAAMMVSPVLFAQSEPMKEGMKTPTHGAPMTGDASWDDVDTNKDGFISKEELKGSPALVTHYEKMDTDHDGKISPAEWKARGPAIRNSDMHK